MLGRHTFELAILEHEQMHQETLLYMLHQLPAAQKVKAAWLPPPRFTKTCSPACACRTGRCG